MRLYELARAYEEAVEQAVDLETGEVKSAELDKLLDEIEGKLEEKALNIAALVVDFEAEAEKVKTRAKDLSARAKALESRSEWLRRYLRQHLAVGTKLKDDRVTLAIVPGSQRVNDILELHKLPSEYKRTEITVLKAEILRDLKAGKHIPGAVLMNGLPSVRIR